MIITYRLPTDTVSLLKEGNKIDFQTAFIEKKSEKEFEINIASQLSIDPKNIFRHLKKLVGEKIEEGELLAEKSGLFSTEKIFAPQTGIIKEIDHHRGILIVSTSGKEKNKILSPFIGEIEKINKDTIQIKINKGEDFSIKNPTSDFGGEVVYLDPHKNLDIDNLSKKIVLAEKVNPYIQAKSEALGIKGFITLEKIPDKTEVSSAVIKDHDDFKKIRKLEYPYCTVISQSAKIYFYQ